MDKITSEMCQLGMFMKTGLPFLANVLVASKEENIELNEEVMFFIHGMKKMNVIITIENTDIIIYHDKTKICKVNAYDYVENVNKKINKNSELEI